MMEKPKIEGKFKIRDFVEFELEYFRQNCNFSDSELQYFNMKSKDKSHIEIAMEMNVSEAKVAKLSKRVRDKIIRVI